MKTNLFVLVMILFTVTVGSAQKAFESVYYVNECKSYNVQFTFIDGYINGSSIEVINNKNQKKNLYLPVFMPLYNDLKWKFILSTELAADSNNDYFIIENMQDLDAVPPTVYLKYYYDEREYVVKLRRI